MRGPEHVVRFVARLLGEADHQDRVGYGDADSHDRSHERLNVERRSREQQHQYDAHQHARNSREHRKRQTQGLKVRHQKKEDRSNGEQETDPKSGDCLFEGRYLPAHDNRAPLGRGTDVLECLIDLLLCVPKRHPVNVCGDAHDTLAAETLNGLRHKAIVQCRDLIQLRLRLPVFSEWQGRERTEALLAIRWNLHLNLESVARLGIAPVVRCDEAGGACGRHERVRNVRHGEAELPCVVAVHVDLCGRILLRLRDGNIPQKAQLAQLSFNLREVGVVLIQIDALHIHLDRRRCAETHHLRHNVARFERDPQVGHLFLES